MARPKKTDLSHISDDILVGEVLRRRQVHEAAIRRMDQLMGRGGSSPTSAAVISAPAKRGPGRPPGSTNKVAAKPSQVGQNKTYPAHCVYKWPSGCSNEHKGPRYSFLCETHRDIGKRERDGYNADYKANNDGHGKPGKGESAPATKKKQAKKTAKTVAAKRVTKPKAKRPGGKKVGRAPAMAQQTLGLPAAQHDAEVEMSNDAKA